MLTLLIEKMDESRKGRGFRVSVARTLQEIFLFIKKTLLNLKYLISCRWNNAAQILPRHQSHFTPVLTTVEKTVWIYSMISMISSWSSYAKTTFVTAWIFGKDNVISMDWLWIAQNAVAIALKVEAFCWLVSKLACSAWHLNPFFASDWMKLKFFLLSVNFSSMFSIALKLTFFFQCSPNFYCWDSSLSLVDEVDHLTNALNIIIHSQ